MQSIYYDGPHGRIHALRLGDGPRLLLAFHGFGDRARMFAVLEEALGTTYTIVAFDLPFHGQTTWRKKTFDRDDLNNMIRQALDAEGQTRFDLMGFSFGARLAQGVLPQWAPQVDKLWLLSPDGVSTRGMRMAVHTPMWIRKAIFRLLDRPGWFLTLVDWGRRMGVAPSFIAQFLHHNLSRSDRRDRVYACWLALNAFYLRRRRIRAIWHERGMPVDIYLGSRDQMIRAKTIYRMAADIPNVRIHALEAGHRIVGDMLNNAMKQQDAETAD